jgi:hypothetical protein
MVSIIPITTRDYSMIALQSRLFNLFVRSQCVQCCAMNGELRDGNNVTESTVLFSTSCFHEVLIHSTLVK